MTSRKDLFIVVILATLVAACGEEPQPRAAGSPAGEPAASTAPASGVDDATGGMVSGVAAGRAEGAAVDLKFELKTRPEVGKPLTIDIALLPKVATPVMQVTYLANEGLTIEPSNLPSRYDRVQPGSVYRHQATVVPREHGVFSLSAVVMVQTEVGDVTRAFSIPVVVGAPPEPEASSAAP